ncbi:MmgE/PrpD family protein [Comamonas sediminis]|uniref:MmgE/PrpD family protein n=1 Tax=Comamonas sediminis TaxID=1783360 RepID=UPI003D2B323D
MTLTQDFARRIADAQPLQDAAAVHAAREGVLDFLASAFPGPADPAWHRLRGVLPQAGGPARVIGQATTADAASAALLNGYAGHALDFDDVHSSVRGHPGTVLLPALFALADTLPDATALDLIDAYIVGVEAMARLGLALGSKHYETGFHNTATLGPLGAAAACARLLKLGAATTENALGLAATQAGGLRLQFGSEAKPLHAGLAARSGLFAAQLAQAGLQGSPGVLEAPIGFLDAYGFGAADAQRAMAGWGSPWQIVTPGLYFKPYACCTATHYAADAALALRAEHQLRAEDIAAVRVVFPPAGDTPLTVTDPATGLEGRFSVEYVLAAALVDGALGLSLFDERAAREDLRSFGRLVSRAYDADAPRASTDPQTRFSTVEVRLHDGRQLSRRVQGLSRARDLAAKYADTTAQQPEALRAVPALVGRMHSRDDLLQLTALFSLVHA